MSETPTPATDPNVIEPDEVRLGGQNKAILERLRLGPASNKHLALISLKYTSRISDLRKAGFTISCRRGEGGLNFYFLRES